MTDHLNSCKGSGVPVRRLRICPEAPAETIASAIHPPPLSVKALETLEEVHHHRALWNWPGTLDSALDYFVYFAAARGELLRPQVFVVYRGEVPEAMLIAKLEQRHVLMRLGWLNFRTPRLRVLTVVYGGLRGSTAQDSTEALVEETLKVMRCGSAGVVAFEPVDVSSELFRALRTLPNKFERGFYASRRNEYRMQLPRSSRELHDMIPQKQRGNYSRRARKLLRDFPGEVRIRWYREASPGLLRDIEFVAQRSYQRDLGVGFQDTPELRGWWELASAKGSLRVCVLYVASQPVAFFSGVVHSGRLWGNYMAYDRRLASYSPGMYLLLRGLGELCDGTEELDIREVSLGPGDSKLKELLSTSCQREDSLFFFPNGLRGLSLNLMISSTCLMDEAARKFLGRRSAVGKALRRLLRRDRTIQRLPDSHASPAQP